MRNKKVYTAALYLSAAMIMYVSCIDEPILSHDSSTSAYLTIPEAQNFFESSYPAIYNRSASPTDDSERLSPGDFTPNWQQVSSGENKHVGYADVPILASYRYKAIHSISKHGKPRAYMVDVTQKLIVFKSRHSGKKVMYILSIIPDWDYHRSHKRTSCSIYSEEGHDFSGHAVYTDVASSKVTAISRYKNGKLLTNVYLPSGKGTIKSRLQRARMLLDGMVTPRIRALSTRSFGEEEIIIGGYIFCGQDFCECFVVEADCHCGNCSLCGYSTCFWCGMDPCICDMYCPVCGYADCMCGGEPSGCGYCGAPDCNGECQNGSSGSSGSSNEGDSGETTVKAKDLFRNSDMIDTNWKLLDKLLEKIAANCMGASLITGLYEALDGATLTIQFTNGEGGGFHFDGQSAGISIGSDNMESNMLFHEMWHAYQAYQETESSFVNSMLNQEIEAHYAQYVYLSSLPEYEESKWEKEYIDDNRLRGVTKIEDYVNDKGGLQDAADIDLFDTFMDATLIPIFHNTAGYEDYKYDDSRSVLSNFSNMQVLTINC